MHNKQCGSWDIFVILTKIPEPLSPGQQVVLYDCNYILWLISQQASMQKWIIIILTGHFFTSSVVNRASHHPSITLAWLAPRCVFIWGAFNNSTKQRKWLDAACKAVDRFLVQIDDVQHNIGGFYLYWKNFDAMLAPGLDPNWTFWKYPDCP